jgi:hypothetical protein
MDYDPRDMLIGDCEDGDEWRCYVYTIVDGREVTHYITMPSTQWLDARLSAEAWLTAQLDDAALTV